MADVATLVLKVESSGAVLNIRRVDVALERLDRQVYHTMRSLLRFSAGVKTMGYVLTGALTAPFVLSARAALMAAGAYTKARISLQTFTGSVARGNRLFNEIVDLAAKTPLRLNDLQEATKMILASGVAARRVIPIMKILGDVSRGDSDILQRLALNLGQVKAMGRLMGRELRDFQKAGVPILGALARVMGAS